MTYSPNLSVAAPCGVPSKKTLTPANGSPVAASSTFPDILPVFGKASEKEKVRTTILAKIVRIIISLIKYLFDSIASIIEGKN